MTAKTSKRLAFLEKMTADGSTEPMAWYGLALEYKSLERFDEALQTFAALRARNADYLPMYLMCGAMLEKLVRKDEAREWYEAGIALAKSKHETHAQSELEAALGAMAG